MTKAQKIKLARRASDSVGGWTSLADLLMKDPHCQAKFGLKPGDPAHRRRLVLRVVKWSAIGIPPEWAPFVGSVTGIPLMKLRPDLYSGNERVA